MEAEKKGLVKWKRFPIKKKHKICGASTKLCFFELLHNIFQMSEIYENIEK
jgi:hypothetical protein